MSEVLLSKPITPGAPYYKRKIRCPGHYLIPPTVDIYKRELVPELKDVSEFCEYKGQRLKMKKMRIVKDKWGRPIIDWKKIHELHRKGIVLWPEITATFAIEHIYDPQGQLCKMCDKRCKEGLGHINEMGIKRLHG
jgi:hypothetical protein